MKSALITECAESERTGKEKIRTLEKAMDVQSDVYNPLKKEIDRAKESLKKSNLTVQVVIFARSRSVSAVL